MESNQKATIGGNQFQLWFQEGGELVQIYQYSNSTEAEQCGVCQCFVGTNLQYSVDMEWWLFDRYCRMEHNSVSLSSEQEDSVGRPLSRCGTTTEQPRQTKMSSFFCNVPLQFWWSTGLCEGIWWRVWDVSSCGLWDMSHSARKLDRRVPSVQKEVITCISLFQGGRKRRSP